MGTNATPQDVYLFGTDRKAQPRPAFFSRPQHLIFRTLNEISEQVFQSIRLDSDTSVLNLEQEPVPTITVTATDFQTTPGFLPHRVGTMTIPDVYTSVASRTRTRTVPAVPNPTYPSRLVVPRLVLLLLLLQVLVLVLLLVLVVLQIRPMSIICLALIDATRNQGW